MEGDHSPPQGLPNWRSSTNRFARKSCNSYQDWFDAQRKEKKMNDSHPVTVTAAVKRKVVALYRSGEGKGVIMKATGISAWKLYRVLDEAGENRRPRGTRSKSQRYGFSEEKIKEMCEAYESMSLQKFLATYSISKATLSRYRSHLGYRRKNKLEWDRDFFSRNTSEVAYWAGFLLADGNVFYKTLNQTQLSLKISSVDHDHIAAFRRTIRSEHKLSQVSGRLVSINGRLGRSEPAENLQLSGGPALAVQLKRWGIIPNKSKHWRKPTFPSHLMRHFLRGWFDGDGTMSFTKPGTQYFKVTGNRRALKWYLEMLRQLGHPGNAYFTKPPMPSSPACDMRINGRFNVLRIASLLYRNGEICLQRKWGIVNHKDWRKKKQLLESV